MQHNHDFHGQPEIEVTPRGRAYLAWDKAERAYIQALGAGANGTARRALNSARLSAYAEFQRHLGA